MRRREAAATERDFLDELQARRAVKLVRACDLSEADVRSLARQYRLSVAELRERALSATAASLRT